MGTLRTRRVGKLIRAELGELLTTKVKDPRLALVSLTEVQVSPDLRRAKVYYSILDEARGDEVEKGLKSAMPYLQRELGTRLQMKNTPRLTAFRDHSLAHGAEMDALIDKVRSQDDAAAAKRTGDDE